MKQDNRNTASPLISVIVPVYNAEKTLRQCVDSILGQDYRDFELLLIDDGSKDDSPSICDEYARQDERVCVFHKLNGGVSSARNLGLDNASGEWITFVDSDDFISDSFFDDVDSHFEDLLLLPYIWMNEDSQFLDKRLNNYHLLEGSPNICSFLNTFLTKSIFRGPCAKFYKRNLLRSIRFDENMKVGEDTCFVHQYLLECKNFCCLHKGAYTIRKRGITGPIKYNSSSTYAIYSLNRIFTTFNQLNEKWGVKKGLFVSYIMYFKAVSREDWKKNPSKWYRNPDVRKMYGYIWDSLLFKDKVKYKVIQLLSVFYR